MSKNLIARLAVAAVAIPVILWISYQGGGWLFGLLLLFAVLGLGEFLWREGWKPTDLLFWLAVVTMLSVYVVLTGYLEDFAMQNSLIHAHPHIPQVLWPMVGFFLISGLLLAVRSQSPAELFARHSRLCWGVVYIGLLYPMVFLVGREHLGIAGGDWLLFLFGLLWVGDTAAMFTGMAIGRHKLAPTVSPNKTVEGFIGGIAGSVMIGLLMYFWKLESIGLGHVIAVAAGASVFGQLGDLVESMWKRALGIKDSSAIIPGHGGVLDRFDSLLFAAPFLYFYLQVM